MPAMSHETDVATGRGQAAQHVRVVVAVASAEGEDARRRWYPSSELMEHVRERQRRPAADIRELVGDDLDLARRGTGHDIDRTSFRQRLVRVHREPACDTGCDKGSAH